MKATMNDEYFNWLVEKIGGIKTSKKLLHTLYFRPFTYVIDMDGNREVDGIDLRYRFGEEKKHSQYLVTKNLDVMPCSILEMMVALCLRCEEQIINDPDMGNQTEILFWDSITSLGLHTSTDDYYDEAYVNHVLDVFLERRYKPNGIGSMFTIPNSTHDLRQVDIWYQAMWYINKYWMN